MRKKASREKAEQRRRLSEKIAAALMAGSMIGTPGGPLSWAVVLGGGIVIAQQGTAEADDVYGGKNTTAGGTVTSSSASASDGEILDNIYGGWVAGGTNTSGTTAAATSNTVTIADSNIRFKAYGGYVAGDGTAANNSLILSNSLIGIIASNGMLLDGFAGGGCVSGNGAANSNTVTLSGGTVVMDVYGGHVEGNGTASSNSVILAAVTSTSTSIYDEVTYSYTSVIGTIYGGGVGSGTASSNSVILSGGSVGGDVYGCGVGSGTASSNSVTLAATYEEQASPPAYSYASVGGTIYGGYAGSGTASSNSVILSGGSASAVYGGYVGWPLPTVVSSGTASGNSVAIDHSNADSRTTSVSGDVAGGYVRGVTTVVSGNSVTIGQTSGTTAIGGNVRGGYACVYGLLENTTATMTSNTVKVSGGSIAGSVAGGALAISSGNCGTIQVSASGNTVSVAGGSIGGNACGAYTSAVAPGEFAYTLQSDAVTGNSAAVSGGTIGGYVAGGYIETSGGTASGNSVTIDHSAADSTTTSVGGAVYGGYVAGGTADVASGNSVTIGQTGGTTHIGGNAYGGYVAGSGTATSNSVTVSGGTIGGDVYGGYIGSGTAADNIINLYGGTVIGTIHGGVGTTTSGNTLNVWSTGLTAGNIADIQYLTFYLPAAITANTNVLSLTTTGTTDLTGTAVTAYLRGDSTLTAGSTVNLLHETSGGTITAPKSTAIKVYEGVSLTYNGAIAVSGSDLVLTLASSGGTSSSGGTASSGGTSDNPSTSSSTSGGTTVIINGGTITSTVSGIAVSSGTASNTSAIVSGAVVSGDLNGAVVSSGSAVGNAAILSGGTVSGAINGAAIVSGTATGNTAILSGGTVAGSLAGAYVSSGTAEGNTAAVEGGAVSGYVWGGCVVSGIATKNAITVNGGTIGGDVCGGYATAGTVTSNTVTMSSGTVSGIVAGGYTPEGGTASGNTASLSGGTVSGTVYGGYASHNATSNTVNLGGATVAGDVYGGYALHSLTTSNTVNWTSGNVSGTIYGGNETDYTGNTLNVYSTGLAAENIAKFQYLNYYLPADITAGTNVISLSTTGSTDLSGTTVTAYLKGDTNLTSGDTLNLIHETGGGTITAPQNTAVKAYEGVSLTHSGTVALTSDSQNLQLTITDANAQLPSQTKSLLETRAGAHAFLNNGADLLAGQGITAALQAAQNTNTAADGSKTAATMPFAAIGTGNMRYNTGSHVDSYGWNGVLGLARQVVQGNRSYTFGPLVEHGEGHYDSYLDDGIHGRGNMNYTGGGILAREDLTNGVYYEASLRAGRVRSDYSGRLHAGGDSSAALLDTSYSADATYYALHLGLGKAVRLSPVNVLDIYAKYFYSHEGSTNVQLSTGDPYAFDSINSHRLRLGTRLTHQVDPLQQLYAGAAFEYEFDGETRATYKGLAAPSPSMKGASGMLEFGWRIKPGEKSALTMDLGASLWAGKQQGFSLNAQFQWKL